MIILRVRTQLHKTHTHTKEKKTSKKRHQKKASIKQWKDRKKIRVDKFAINIYQSKLT